MAYQAKKSVQGAHDQVYKSADQTVSKNAGGVMTDSSSRKSAGTSRKAARSRKRQKFPQ